MHLSSSPYVLPPVRIRNVGWRVPMLPLVNSITLSCLRHRIIQAQQISYAFCIKSPYKTNIIISVVSSLNLSHRTAFYELPAV
jgi:uncharacterized membrane protein